MVALPCEGRLCATNCRHHAVSAFGVTQACARLLRLDIAPCNHLAHAQEATDIYKSLLLDHRDLLALNVYVALCYAKLDYFDVSSDVVAHYLAAFPTSPTAVNLLACNAFRLQDGAAAEAELRGLADATRGRHVEHELIRHNLVAFQGGKNALQVLPALGDEPPEARLNLAIQHLRSGALDAAEALLAGVDPATPHEFILKVSWEVGVWREGHTRVMCTARWLAG